MDQIFAECTQVTSTPGTVGIESGYYSGCIDEPFHEEDATMETLPGFSTVSRTGADRWDTETVGKESAEAELTTVKRMAELAKRIESSAGSSSAWSRFAGQELCQLRSKFGKLLQGVLQDAGCDPQKFLVCCQPDGDFSDHKDLLLSYRIASLLVTLLRESLGQDVARIEIGCVSGTTEFTCFIAEKSVGITVQRNDNLFALCTNGGWHVAPGGQMPDFAYLRRTIEMYGGMVEAEKPRVTGVKVTFPIAI